MEQLARVLILFGVITILIGIVFLLGPKIPFLGRLPGDILIRRGDTTIYVPIVTSLLLSIVLSVLLSFFWR